MPEKKEILFVDIFSLRMKRGHIHFLIFFDKILCMSVDFWVVWGHISEPFGRAYGSHP